MAFLANGALTYFDFARPMSSENTDVAKSNLVIDPELIGPDKLCNVFGSVIGSFFGAGDPATDVYSWKIFGPSNQLIFQGSGGSGFQSISYTFSEIGNHQIELSVTRGIEIIYEGDKSVEVIKGPTIVLKPEYSVCQNQEIKLTVLDPSSGNFSEYIFEWKNENGTIVGNKNELTTSDIGIYEVKFSFSDSNGNQVCETSISTEVKAKTDVQVIASTSEACPDFTVYYSTLPLTSGDWYFKKKGDPTLISLGSGNAINVRPNIDLPGIGDYEIVFETVDSENPSCDQKKVSQLSYLPQPDFVILNSSAATGCNSFDGKLIVQALTPLNYISLDGLGVSSPSLNAGEVYEFSNLESGAYTLISVLGPCSNAYGTVVPLINPPNELEFVITDLEGEYCTSTGKEDGSFTINMVNGKLDGSYRIINVKGTIVKEVIFEDEETFEITIPGGTYFFEIFDNNGCKLPESQEIVVPSLTQVEFLVPSDLSICQSFDLIPSTNDDLIFTLTSPTGIIEEKKAGEAFTIFEEGEYSLIGINPSQTELCPNQRTFIVKLVKPINFEPRLIQEDCFGNRTYEAEIFGLDPKTVIFNWTNENNEVVGTGQFLDLAPSFFGNYSLDVQPSNSLACPIPPKQVLILEPILSVELELENSNLCEFGSGSIISLTIDQPEAVTNISWRKFTIDSLGAEIIENLPQFDNQLSPEITEKGIYEAAVFSIIPAIGKNCELGRKSIEISVTTEKVDFTLPTSLSICESYEFTPETTQDLTFEITYPNGETTSRQSGKPFNLNQNGTYLFLGISNDQVPTLCPELKSMEVTINKKIPFTPELFQESCDGTKIYKADIGTVDPAKADFFWFDESGIVIGNGEFLTLNSYGNFSLDVQPKGSIPCEQEPIIFLVEVPILELPVSLIAEPLCPESPSTPIRVETQFEFVNRIEWWFTNPDGIEIQLSNQANKREILAFEEGTYEVRIFNQINCLLGFDRVLVIRSSDATRPNVKDIYQVCPKYEIAETINPGQFDSYEWYHEGTLVSTSSTYKPLLIGNFELIVFSAEGCAYQTSFVTVEECELKVTFPNAIQPGNPEKPFLIYTNYLIDELEIWVFSKWGEVIFHCERTELISEESTCLWDGYLDDQKLPPGSYAFRVNFRNNEKNISNYQLGTILIID